MGRRNQRGAYEPTLEEIAAACAAIQSKWSDREYHMRAGYPAAMLDDSNGHKLHVDIRVESAREPDGTPMFYDLDL